ncbi:hypothetical protein MtrunA17_Chr3g0123911 [Medicago truncatula]|uniref:Uncharacterized protein n=1 Tax=Medicago truncatula TaxID=3880 RepID=G7J3Q6_MEDTR|nr:hypothetical protein MTR_3g087080 [Medicago truncatula]RHN69366.1 hypothetical protein MtrunA17_Chr3g0123911 [Medicago truncatula]
MSVEAYAMAGVDCKECGINYCALRRSLTPPQAKSENDLGLGNHRMIDNSLKMNDEWVKMKMREWATAVASNNETNANLRVSEILLIMDHNHHKMPGN